MTERRAALRAAQGKEAVDYRALADFRYALRKFLAFSKVSAEKAGLTPRQHQALLTIKGLSDGAGIPVGLLAERLLIRQHTAGGLVDRLERGGLARRNADPQDGRRVLVSLTAEGEKRLRKLSAVHLEELRTVGPALAGPLAALQAQAGT